LQQGKYFVSFHTFIKKAFMQLKTTIAIIFIYLSLFACKNTLSPRVIIYSDSGSEILNGNVKELYATSSFSKQNFDKLTFDKDGRMKTRTVRDISIGTIENKTDTTIYVWKNKYTYQYKKNKLFSITSETSGSSTIFKSRWNIDESGRLAKYTGDVEDENHNVGSGKYDAVGNLIEWTRVESPTKIDPVIHQFKYGNQNRIVESVLSEPAEQPLIKTTYQYILFDFNKNWLKAIVHIKRIFPTAAMGSRTDTITRKITYY
jgi:hypothetical protein